MRDGGQPNTACTGTNFIFIATYLDSFDPDTSARTGSEIQAAVRTRNNRSNSWNVDDGQTFVVVVSEVAPEAGCPHTVFHGDAGGNMWRKDTNPNADSYGDRNSDSNGYTNSHANNPTGPPPPRPGLHRRQGRGRRRILVRTP